MKRILAFGFILVLSLALAPARSSSSQAAVPLDGKIIALDAGHGGDELGAQYPAMCADDGDPSDCEIYEKDVNLATVYILKENLETGGACVVLTRRCNETMGRRKDRVDLAEERCKSECGGECDILVSNHHNGSEDPSYDGLLAIYNNKKDKALATALHDALWQMPSNPEGFVDEGYDKGGYGMTVYFTPAALTEGYYITNDWEADQYLSGEETTPAEYSSDKDVSCARPIRIGSRVEEEGDALYQGIVDYFGSSGGGGDDDGGNGGGPPCEKNPGHPHCR